MEITQAGNVLPAHTPENESNVSSLVKMAIERGVDVEVLERLVALQERVTERNARASFIEALARFQEQCPEIPKSKTAQIVTKSGARFNYSYAPLESITRTIREPLRANGLSYSWDVSLAGGALLVTANLRHIDGHSECSTFPVPIDKSARMSDAQAHGAALTYGRRQSLIAVLGLTTADEDVDGQQVGATKHASDDEPEQITQEQAAGLDALIDEVGGGGAKGAKYRARFLEWLQVESIAHLPPHDYQRALDALEEARRQGA